MKLESSNSPQLMQYICFNINTAAKEELMTLPGIGETKAQRIIEYRETHGRFSDIEALKNVPGIKSGTYDALKEFITV